MNRWQWFSCIFSADGPRSPTTRLVLAALYAHMNRDSNSCFPGTRLLAVETGLSERSVCTHLELAAKAGWIEIRERAGSGKGWRSNEYIPRIPGAEGRSAPLGLEGTEGDSAPLPEGAEGDSARTGMVLNVVHDGAEPDDSMVLNDVQPNCVFNSLFNKEKKRSRADASFSEEVEVLGFLNEHAGRRFEPFDPDGKPSKALQGIRHALKRITPLEARRIVILKTREWGTNPDMRKHINPITLYGRKANLEKYLAEVREYPWGRAS